MADVKEQPIRPVGIGAKVVDVMQGDGELDHAEVGGQVPAVAADRIDDTGPHLGCQLGQLFRGASLEVGRTMDPIEQRWRVGGGGHLIALLAT